MTQPATAAAPETPTRRTPDPTLGFTLRLVAIAAPLGALVALAHSRTLIEVAAAVFGLVVLLSFPSPNAVRLLGVALVLTPDAVVVAHVGSSPVSLRDVALVALYAVLVLTVVRGRLRMRVPMPLLMTALLVAAVAGALQNQRPKSLLEFTIVILLPPVAGAVLATDREIALDFLRGATAGTILLVVTAYAESLTNHNYLVTSTALGSFARTGHVRANAGWDYPTMLSAFICLAGFFVVEALQRRWGLFGVVLGGAFVTAGVITTQSRSGLLGLGAGALVYLLLQRQAGQAVKVVFGLGFAAVVLVALPGATPGAFRSFVQQSLTPGSAANANVHYREQLYRDFWPAIAHHPLFGYGYGSGKSVATNQLQFYFGTQTDLASLPVSLGVELGYVGAGAIFLMLIVALAKVASARDLPARLGLGAGLVASAVAMFGVPVSPPLTWMLLVAGLAWSLVRTHRQVASAKASDEPAEAPGPPAVGPGSRPGTAGLPRAGGGHQA